MHEVAGYLLKDKQSIVVMSGGGSKTSAEGKIDLRINFANLNSSEKKSETQQPNCYQSQFFL